MVERTAGQRAYRWVRKLHMYAGLLTYSNFTLFGVAGLVATCDERPEARAPYPSVVERAAFAPAAGASDKQMADALHARLDPPLAGPVPEWALRDDEAGNLLVSFYSVNGPTHVRVLEKHRAIEIERVRNPLPRFLSNLHALTPREWTGDWRLLAWAVMNEVALWTLLGLALSGVYLWLATRPRLRLALGASVGGAAAFVVLYAVIR